MEPPMNWSGRDEENRTFFYASLKPREHKCFQKAGLIDGVRFIREVKTNNESKVPIGLGN